MTTTVTIDSIQDIISTYIKDSNSGKVDYDKLEQLTDFLKSFQCKKRKRATVVRTVDSSKDIMVEDEVEDEQEDNDIVIHSDSTTQIDYGTPEVVVVSSLNVDVTTSELPTKKQSKVDDIEKTLEQCIQMLRDSKPVHAAFMQRLVIGADDSVNNTINESLEFFKLKAEELAGIINRSTDPSKNPVLHNISYQVAGEAYEQLNRIWKISSTKEKHPTCKTFIDFLVKLEVKEHCKPTITCYRAYNAVFQKCPAIVRLPVAFSTLKRKKFLSNDILLKAVTNYEATTGKRWGETE